MKRILLLVVVTVLLTACASPPKPTPTPSPSPVPPANPPPPTLTRTVLRPTLTATPRRVAKATISPPPSRTPKCAGLKAGLYVIGVEPLTELIWDAQQRSFKVMLCNANPGATSAAGELSVFIYVAGAKRPMGQTSLWIGAIPPGYQERIVGDWKPGLENHKTICVQKSAVELEVVFREERQAGWFQAIRFPDGHSKTLYPIRCAGDYA